MDNINTISAFWNAMYDKSNEKKGQALIQRIEDKMNFEQWGFRRTHSNFPSYLRVIYDSEWCRVKFIYTRGRFPDPSLDEFSIDYGRLHAPNDQATMTWQGQQCNCWHNNRLVLFFLDGMTPQEIMEWEKDGGWLCKFKEQYRQSEPGKEMISSELWAEHWILSEAATWQQYGQRLFEVFDLRRPDLWEEYNKFHSEYHRLKGTQPPSERIANIVAPLTKIC